MPIKLNGSMLTAALLAMSFTGIANATEENHPTPGPINFWSAVPVATKTFKIQPVLSFAYARGGYGDDGVRVPMADGDYLRQSSLSLYGSYGLFENFDVSAMLSLVRNSVSISGASANSTRMGDSAVYARYQFVKETENRPAVAGIVAVGIPTGKYENGDPAKLGTDISGDGAYDIYTGFMGQKTLGKFNLYTSLTVDFPFESTINNIKTQYGKSFHYNASAEYVLPYNLNAFLEMNAYTQGRTDYNSTVTDGTKHSTVALTPGFGWTKDNMSAFIGYTRSLCGRNDEAFDSVTLSALFTF